MKFLAGWAAAAALVLSATAGNAQAPVYGAAQGRYMATSDLDGPYYGPNAEHYGPYVEPEVPPPAPRYGYGYGYGYGYQPPPALVPAEEVYAVLRQNGFSPLGIPHLRGFVYTIAVIDPRGDDGRLVIDARDGRIVRFIPAYGYGRSFSDDAMGPYDAQDAMPPPMAVRGVPRPPAPIPHVASRTVPVPKSAPQRGEVPVVAAKPASPEPPPHSSTTAQASAQTPPPVSAAPTVQAKPQPTILPTKDMPPVQGLD